MKIENLIGRLGESHLTVSLRDFARVAGHFGYSLDHVAGSHYVFRNWTGRKYVVPVHRRKIKAIYVRNFIKEQR